MSSAEADLSQIITKMKDDLKALTGQRDHLKKQLLDYEAAILFSENKTQGKIHLIKSVFEERNQKEVKLLTKKILEKYPDIVILFGIKAAGKAQLLFQRSEELAFDMGRLMETACAVINGRGGGRPQQAQGGGSAVQKLEDALQKTEDILFDMINSV